MIKIVLVPFIAVDLTSLGDHETLSNSIHLISTGFNPFYGFIGSYYKIFKVNF